MGRIKPVSPNQGEHIQVNPKVSSQSTNELHPAFSFKYMVSGKYHLNECTQDEKLSLVEKMLILSQMTWSSIQKAPKHGLGHEKISRDSIRGSFPKTVTEDVTILAFRFSGKKPMVGFRKEKIFYIIWLDRDFSLYGH